MKTILLLVTFLVYATTTIALANPMFNLVSSLKDTKASDECCLPDAFSFKQHFTNLIVSNNVIVNTTHGITSTAADYKNRRWRQDVFSTENQSTLTTWVIGVNTNEDIRYISKYGSCNCRRIGFDWNVPCVKSGYSITGTVGQYDANLMSSYSGEQVSKVFTFREPKMRSDKCWVLSQSTYSTNMIEISDYIDMTEKIGNSVFDLPSNCPAIQHCD